MDRRGFMQSALGSLAAVSLQGKGADRRLGLDVFSVRSQGWSPFEYIDYAARQKADVIFFSEVRFLGGTDPAHLAKIKDHARRNNLGIESGDTSICPTSHRFENSMGTAEEKLGKLIEIAQALGSPVVRCFLGTAQDRVGKGGIYRHIENTVGVLKAVRNRAQDAGVKIAIENHAGDMQGWELRGLIEAAGKDFVGAVIDSGNATWTLEDPMVTLEVLAPYCLTTGVRDSAIWRVPEGIAVQWVRMGEGNVGIEAWSKRFFELCPDKTFALEIICLPPRIFPVLDQKFWSGYERVKAHEFARFLAIAENGAPRPPFGKLEAENAKAAEREDLEASVRYCKTQLGL